MKKTIWILNHYAGNMLLDRGGRHYSFAKYLHQDGYDPVVFCSNSKHNERGSYFSNKKIFTICKAKTINVPFIFVKGRSYSDNGIQRIFNMIDFYINVRRAAKIYAKNFGKPDVIYASSVHPLTLVAGIQLAKKYKVKCVCEVRDLWPESLVVYGMIKNESLITKFLYKGERWIYRKADELIFTMEGGKDYIVNQKWQNVIPSSKIHYINNGVDLEVFDNNMKKYKIIDPDLEDSRTFKLIYTGSIRKANDIDILLDVAKQIADPQIKFLIWGSGDKIEALSKRITQEKIGNVILKGVVEKRNIPYILSRADICLMHGRAPKLAEYGMSLNKSFEYLAAGKPIISTMMGNYDYIAQNGAGYCVNMNDTDEYISSILKIKNLSKAEYELMCRNSRMTAKNYDFKKLTRKLENIFKNL